MKDLRSEIDILHQEIFKLLNLRLDLVRQIWDYKKTIHRGHLDLQRENHLIHQFDDHELCKNNSKLMEYHQNIVKSILYETKKYYQSETD